MVPTSLRIALAVCVSVTASAQTARGTSFDIHLKLTAVGDGPMATAMQAQQAEWRGAGLAVGSRGRIDLLEGGQPPVMQKGDYVLFDGLESVVVNPAEKSFLLLQAAAQMMSGQTVMGGIQIAVKNITVKLDTLGAGESIEGRATTHYRLSSSHDMTMSGSAMPDAPTIATAQTTDLWLADVANVPETPFTRATGSTARTPSGPMAELISKMAVAGEGLPRGKTVVRQLISVRVTLAGMTAGTDNLTELSGIKGVDVDLDRLVLPAGFTERTLPNFPAPDSTSRAAADKWRRPPQ